MKQRNMETKRMHSRKPEANDEVQNEGKKYERMANIEQETITRGGINYARPEHKGKRLSE